MTPSDRAVARRAFDALCRAGETGDWTALLALTGEEFEFWFPAGKFRGQHRGLDGKARFLEWIAHRAASRSKKTLELELYGDPWAVFCLHSQGADALGAFETQVAIFFRVSEGRISGYREYIGDIQAWL